MSELSLFHLAVIRDEIAALGYRHLEGGAYVYVRFLSLLRNVPGLLPDADDARWFAAVQERLNAALTARFGEEQERFFNEVREEVLRRLGHHLDVVAPLSSGVAAL